MNEYHLPFATRRISTRHARVTATGDPGGIRVRFAHGVREPGILIPAPGRGWDLSAFTAIALEVRNLGKTEGAIVGQAGPHSWTDGIAVIAPGATETLWILLKRQAYPPRMKTRFPGMNGMPGDTVWIWDAPDPARVPGLRLYAVTEAIPEAIEVAGIRAVRYNTAPEPRPMDPGIFPLVDGYGQYRHREWPGKVHGDRDLAAARNREDADLRAHPVPPDRNRWGGWAKGPRRRATGHFRTEKVDGRWWLVDPEGRLFWSHGITCVNTREATRMKGRELFFGPLPRRGPLAGFRHGDAFDFYGANLRRKYGARWREEAGARAHRRLRSWGMNTVANWSDRDVCGLRRTPYCINLPYRRVLDSHGFPDMANPACRAALREGCRSAAKETANDPWCIGWFIDNELHWPNVPDLGRLADDYYRVCRDEMKAIAPRKLFLGSRIHMHEYPFGGSHDVVRAAARWCDVVSFNRYRFTAADLRLPDGCDKPIVIGEWHFGALDRGMLHTGLRSAGTQAQRGATYGFYLRGALRNPAIVGAHWFQYHDQCLTGRFDGENYQIGFLDICDTPYPETIAGARAAGYGMYELRSRKG